MTTPIHITHVIVGLDVGGAERFLLRLIDAHRGNPQYAHRVISLTGKGTLGPQLEAQGIAVTALGMQSLRDTPRTYIRLKRALQAHRPDVLQCWMYYADLLGGLAGRRLGIKRILWGIRNSHFESGGTRLKRAVRRSCAIASRHLPWRIVCVADSALEVHARAGYDRSRMEVIHNGYDPETFTYSDTGRHRLRRELGIPPDSLVIGSLGRYSAAKDHHSFVQAADAAMRQRRGLYFMLVGRDLTRENQALARQIAATPHPERFLLLGQRSDVIDCLSAMDVFCLHSRTEGFPNALGEAMCAARPCITTDVGDARQLLGQGGRVVPAGDVPALTQAMIHMADLDATQLQAMGARARGRIADHYTMNHAVDRFESLYQTAMALPY
ncbi:glycosyltransferase [Pollutimonas sp. H1-120]|uniref:glycosyltransferase family 4 protein n=1 Tax=Pollutimonas sp. H1-120 TaxID=3148824 RepID=UPI003B52ABF2